MTLLVSGAVRAQDTAAVVRHLLPLDLSRLQPYHRMYDVIVTTRDSAIVIGQRDVSLGAAEYAGAPAWMIVEQRTGLVPAAESLYLAHDFRPLHWSSVLGTARLSTEFVGDSIYGATSGLGGKRNVVFLGRPDLLVSTAMIEAVLPLLPLAAGWTDSAAVLAVDLASDTVIAAELSVIGEEDFVVDSATTRASWVVVLRADPRSVLFWVAKEGGEVLRMQQATPAHVGSLLEFRARPPAPVVAPERLPP